MINSRYVTHIKDTLDFQGFLDCSDIDYEIDNRNKIEDLDLFIRKLKEDNLYSKEIEEFIENFIKFYND